MVNVQYKYYISCTLFFTGILYGTLTMEYGGKVCIECEKTGYKTDIEFKLKVCLKALCMVAHIRDIVYFHIPFSM